MKRLAWVLGAVVVGACSSSSSGPAEVADTGVDEVSTTFRPDTNGDSADANQVMVAQGGTFYSPQTLNIHVGETVTWVWATDGHSVTSGTCGPDDAGTTTCTPTDPATDPEAFDSQIKTTGFVFTHTFTHIGQYPYYCRFHGFEGMVGTIVVGQ